MLVAQKQPKMKIKTYLSISLLFNLALAAILAFIVVRLGGFNYAWFRIRNGEEAMYFHRKNQFEILPEKQNAIVFLGDSQTEQCEWKELWGDTLPILNRGISGDHVQGIKERLDAILKQKPKKIFLCVGVNDLLFGKTSDEISRTYREIVAQIRKETPFAQLFLQSVLPINTKIQWLGIDNESVKILNLQIEAIAKEYALPYIDLTPELINVQGDLSEKYTQDGVHLNGLGYKIWKKKVQTFIQ
jgi:lysophospholipase L1-like esterase